MNARLDRQGGWARNFVVISAVLVFLLVGGVYFLKSKEVSKENIDGLSTPLESSDGEDTEIRSSQQVKISDKKETGSGNTSTAEQKSDATVATGASAGSDSAHEGATALPQTGPAETTGSVVILSVLVYSIAAYIISRRRLTL